MLSKKYYKVLAGLIGNGADLDDFTRKLCHYLKEDNSRFDYTRFITEIDRVYTEFKIEQALVKEVK